MAKHVRCRVSAVRLVESAPGGDAAAGSLGSTKNQKLFPHGRSGCSNLAYTLTQV